jgi:hypothetical protein
MEFYIQLKNITKRNILPITNEQKEEVGKIKFLQKKGEKNLEITNFLTMKKYYINSNPFKLKNRFIINDDNGKEMAKIQVGYKIIHSILEKGEYYFVKSAFFQVKYRVYQDSKVVSRLDVVRKDNERFYKITSNDDDFINIIAVFLLARAVRIKALLH